jgi:NCS2 family nucleobase:cation symporter-2
VSNAVYGSTKQFITHQGDKHDPTVAPPGGRTVASLHPLLESGILLTAVAAVALNLSFNGTRDVPAASHTDAGATNHHPIVQGSKA